MPPIVVKLQIDQEARNFKSRKKKIEKVNYSLWHLIHLFLLGVCLGMLRFVCVLVIEMYKSTLNLGEKLELLLQGFPNVMSISQRHVCGQDYVNLHKVVKPKGVRPDRVNMSDGFVVVPT